VNETLSPRTAEEVRDAVAWALGAAAPLEIVGGGTKRGWGHPPQSGTVLDLAGLSGVTLHEPEELVLSAHAGTPLGEIEKRLAEAGQLLAFEPPDFGPLFGAEAGRQTLGGVIATNLSGSRRIKAGAARDHFLGVAAVTGRAEAIKAGGRVVKNVTGYDLCKLFAGSFGTLGVLTELTVKVLPAPEKTRTAFAFGLDDKQAAAALSAALNSAHEVSGAAHLPGAVAARSAVDMVRDPGKAVTAVRVEGPGPSVEYRCKALRALLSDYGPTEELHGHRSSAFWREAGNVAPLLPDADAAIWRLSVAPARAPAILAEMKAGLNFEHFLDWGGGLIWVATRQMNAHDAIRGAIPQGEGHATLIRGGSDAPAFHPQPEPVAALSRRLREQFDPSGILNPGRMGG
jgi:glycolate oxidase FAD binding subunit